MELIEYMLIQNNFMNKTNTPIVCELNETSKHGYCTRDIDGKWASKLIGIGRNSEQIKTNIITKTIYLFRIESSYLFLLMSIVSLIMLLLLLLLLLQFHWPTAHKRTHEKRKWKSIVLYPIGNYPPELYICSSITNPIYFSGSFFSLLWEQS